MKKEEIYNQYAIEQGYESWRELTNSYGLDGQITTSEYLEHQNAVTDLIQEELKKKINLIALDTLELFNSEYEILSNVILNTEIL